MDDEEEEDWKKGCYRDALDDFLKNAIYEWKRDREISWSSGGPAEDIEDIVENLEGATEEPLQKQEVFDKIEELAEAIFKSSLKFGDSQHLSNLGHDLTVYFFCPEFVKHTGESLEPHLAGSIIAKLSEAANRLVNLGEDGLWAFEQVPLSSMVKKFLRSAIRSYVWGFDAQCLAFCRSAIEDVLGSKLRDVYKERGETFDEYNNSLHGYIIFAEQEGLLDKEYVQKARDVRIRANHVLHRDPGLIERTQDTIHKTAQVIAVIETGSDPLVPSL